MKLRGYIEFQNSKEANIWPENVKTQNTIPIKTKVKLLMVCSW